MKYLPLLFLLLSFPLIAQNTTLDEELIFIDDEGITVVGTVPVSQQRVVIEKEQIENSSAGDVVNLLQETLGLNIVRYGAYGNQAGINLRGFDSKRIAFLIDGLPVNSSLDGKFDINQINLNSIERIEVIYGGSDSKFNVSGAFGGIVNIITVKKQDQGLTLSASVSNTSSMPGAYRDRNGETQEMRWEDLLDTQNYSLVAAFGKKSFSMTANIFANRAENHFLFTDRNNYTRRKDNNEIWDAGGSASFVWELADLTKLIASTYFFYGDSNFPSSGFSSYVGNQKDFTTRQNFMIDMPKVFHDNLSTELSLGWQLQRRDYTSPAAVVSIHDQHNLMIINRWTWFTGNHLTLRSGVDYRFISLDSTEIGRRNRHDGGFYLTAEIKPFQSFLIIPSAKVIFTSEGSENFSIIPKLGFLWNVTEYFSFKNNYFRNFKFPDFEELYWSGGGGFGNPNLRPEDGWGADLGASWRITELFQIESVFFSQWIRDSIHWFSKSGGIWRPENVGEAVIFGFDSKINYVIPVSGKFMKKINTSLSYQYLLSYLLSYGYNLDSNKRIPYNPEHTINSSLEFFWSNGSFSINGQYQSIRFHDTANITVLKPFFLLNAGINQNIGKNFIVFGTLRNILNISYESFNDYPMPGITLTLGIRTNLEFKND